MGVDAYDLCTSQLTLDEAAKGDIGAAEQRLAVPAKALDDAYHVVVAAVNGVGFLVTSNCKHIANLQMRPLVFRALP